LNNSNNTKGPLAGVRALELAEIWAGPYCGAMLSDMGAEIIKVESVQRISRGPIKPAPGAPGYPDGDPGERPWNRSANFNVINRNKQGITLNLTDAKGVEVFKELASVSDVVFCNSAFGVMEKFGLGYEELRQVKPDLIVLFMPGYGNTGPYKGIRSMGMSIDAISGHSSLRGYPDLGLERLSPVHHPDAVGGVTAAFAVCAALHHRARTGKGQFIDISQAEAFIPHLGEIYLESGLTGKPRDRRGNRHPAMAPHGVYPCQGEDSWVAISVRTEAEWHDLCQVMGSPGLSEDSRFSTLDSRLSNIDSLDDAISQWTSQRDNNEVTKLLQNRGIPAGPVLNCNTDTYDDPHLQDRDYFQTIVHPDAGTHLLSGPIWKRANESEPRHEPAPGLGQHNNLVLEEVLGLTSDQIQILEQENVIGTVPLTGSDMGGVRRVQRGI
jgi:crotonobetainyl-CoA:carnitine CoA-transferase CaiB-like acyl-CoA transferase